MKPEEQSIAVEPDVNDTVARVIRVGVYFSAVCLGLGLLLVMWTVVAGDSIDLTYAPRQWSELIAVAEGSAALTLVALGLLGLILTQGLILVGTLAVFTRLREYRFVAVSLLILVILTTGAFLQSLPR